MSTGYDGTTRLSVSAVGAATGYSAQQIRDLEDRGVLAPAARAENGYRQFNMNHVRDLHCYRDLAYAVGPLEARRTMSVIRTTPPEDAASLVASLHARLNDERDRALTALDALAAIRDEVATDATAAAGDSMGITELAEALGVRSSALRFWEQQGLVSPDRIETHAGSVRVYHPAAIRQARITAALRAAGYRIPEVQRSIAAIRDVGDGADVADLQSAVDVLTGRLHTIGDRTLALMRSAATLEQIISTSS